MKCYAKSSENLIVQLANLPPKPPFLSKSFHLFSCTGKTHYLCISSAKNKEQNKTFLPFNFQNIGRQLVQYAASANSQKQTGTDIRSEDAGPAALSSGQGIGLMRPRHSACENAPHVHRLFRKRGYRGGIRIRVRRDYRRGFGRRRAISISAA